MLTVITSFLLQNKYDVDAFFEQLLLWVIVLIVSFIVCCLVHLMLDDRQSKIVVTKDEIHVFKIFAKPQVIAIDQIVDFKTERIRLHSNRVPIGDGARITTFSVRAQNDLVLSQDKYANYDDLINFIIKDLKK